MKKALILKNKRYKFGLSLNKGETVLIKETVTTKGIVYTGFREGEPVVGFGLNSKDFKFEDGTPIAQKEFRITYRMEFYTKACSEAEALANFENIPMDIMVAESSYVERVSIDEEN